MQILLMSGVTVTSASQILESFWNIWSQVSQRKKPFSDFQARGPVVKHVVLACIHYREGYTKWLSWSADLESSNEGGHRVNFDRNLCTYQCKSREGGVRARGGDLMPETIPLSGF